jgi:hypothetical protein
VNTVLIFILVHKYVHTYTHTCMHTYMHTYMYTYVLLINHAATTAIGYETSHPAQNVIV